MRLTIGTMRILVAFLIEPNRAWYCYDLARELKVPQGSVTLILARMVEEYGWLERYDETHESAGTHTGPPRVYYDLTDRGRKEILAMLRPLQLPPRIWVRQGAEPPF